MHNIIIPENSSSNCFDSVRYSLLKYYNLDYEAYNIKYFYTDYYMIPLGGTVGYICRGKYNENMLNYIYDINLIFKDKDETKNLLETVSALLNDCPIGIVIDPYYCHWSPFYQKSHNSHIILIVDIDYEDKKYICFDVHFNSVGYVKVDFDIINENFNYYFTINLREVKKVNFKLLLDKIELELSNFDNDLDAKKMEMTNYFLMNDNKLLFSENIETSMPLINLMWIAEDKKHFSIFLRYIENKIKNPVFSSIYELLSISERNFLLLKFILMKYAKTGVLNEDKLKNIINRIFDTDALMVEKMKKILMEIKY